MIYDYTEVSKGDGMKYQEMVIPKSEIKRFIKNGWRITRFAKLEPNKIHQKWKNSIDAMEKQNEI